MDVEIEQKSIWTTSKGVICIYFRYQQIARTHKKILVTTNAAWTINLQPVKVSKRLVRLWFRRI
jgi:hypothetical protein